MISNDYSKSLIGICLALTVACPVAAENTDAQSQASIDTVMAFMEAMGNGDMQKMDSLMADDMVWHNEGDKGMPWIGPWKGKQEIFKFFSVFNEHWQTTKWENEDVLAVGETVAVFGTMNGITTASGKEIGDFTFAMRAKVEGGKLVLWNFLEDSYSVSQAFHGK